MNLQGVGEEISALPCLEASELIRRVTDRAFHDVRRLANILSRVKLDSRREDLLDYIRLNRARFIKAYATISWLSGSHGELVVNANNALSEAQAQRQQIDTCQDQFFFMHGGLFGARQRLYDIPVAVDVLVGGHYSGLPKGIEYCGGDLDPHPLYELPAIREEIVPRVERAIRLCLLRRGGVPSQFTSHIVRNGVLTLTVKGEFELTVSLQEEGQDTMWTLLGVKVMVQAREGESVTAPLTDIRQQRYLHEVVQKAMDVSNEAGESTSVPLLAAYQVCHDLCCSMILEILHAQAQKLAARVGGLWATQLTVVFHKEAQVLDLCLWQREFCTGLAGTGRDVGMGDCRGGDITPQHPQGVPLPETPGEAISPPTPAGCRYMRVHRPVDRVGQIEVSLGPVGEQLRGGGCEGGTGDLQDTACVTVDEGGAADVLLKGAVQVNPDMLSCGHMLLAAARTFASQKIVMLARDLEELAQELGTHSPAAVIDGISACIFPWGDGNIEVSVDLKSGRYVVQDTLSDRNKSMARCNGRLGEALNLLPRTDTQSLGTSILAALSVGQPLPAALRPPTRYAHDGEQQDLRQQQVNHCMAESLGLLRRDEVEQVLRRKFGMVPCQRWQALLGRAEKPLTNSGFDSWGQDHSGTLRSFVCLAQFRERGVHLSDEWRRRRRRSRMRRRCVGVIELTTAERAATVGRVPTSASAGGGLQYGSLDTLSENLDLPNDWRVSDGTLPELAASLAEVCDGDEVDSSRLLFPAPSRKDALGESNATPLAAISRMEETDEVLYFFLEAAVSANMCMEHTLVVAALSKVVGTVKPVRPKVSETYRIKCSVRRESSSCDWLEVALLPSDENVSLLGKRSASHRRASDCEVRTRSNSFLNTYSSRLSNVSSTGLPSGLTIPAVEARSSDDHILDPASSSEIEVHEAVQMGKALIPFARLQHALQIVGTGLSLDLHGLSQLPIAVEQASCCTVILGGEEGWSNAQLAATSARVYFFPGHCQADSWMWNVTLGAATRVMDYASTEIVETEERKAVQHHLQLVETVEVIGGESSLAGTQSTFEKSVDDMESSRYEGGEITRNECKSVRFRFPPSFPVHAMCRSFALAGEGLSAMLHLISQATMLPRVGSGGAGYAIGSFSPIHIALRDASCGHVVLLTHSAFSATLISSAERPGLVLIPQPGVATCPVAVRELEASVRKHLDLRALLHGLSRIVPVLAVVAQTVPGVGRGTGTPDSGEGARGKTPEQFVLTAVSPACFVLSSRLVRSTLEKSMPPRPVLTLMIEAGERVRVSSKQSKSKSKGDVVVNTATLRDLLLDWIASKSVCNSVS